MPRPLRRCRPSRSSAVLIALAALLVLAFGGAPRAARPACRTRSPRRETAAADLRAQIGAESRHIQDTGRRAGRRARAPGHDPDRSRQPHRRPAAHAGRAADLAQPPDRAGEPAAPRHRRAGRQPARQLRGRQARSDDGDPQRARLRQPARAGRLHGPRRTSGREHRRPDPHRPRRGPSRGRPPRRRSRRATGSRPTAVLRRRNDVAALQAALLRVQLRQLAARDTHDGPLPHGRRPSRRPAAPRCSCRRRGRAGRRPRRDGDAERKRRRRPGSRSTPAGMVQPPPGAPAAVARVIAAANAIATLPYVWGGGHGSFQANGYDCSGSVSLRARRRRPAHLTARLGRVRELGRARSRPLDHRLRQRRSRLDGSRGLAL